MSNVTYLSSRRILSNGEVGFEYVCGICDTTIFTAIRFDAFPSCLMCRAMCRMSDRPAPPDELVSIQRGRQAR